MYNIKKLKEIYEANAELINILIFGRAGIARIDACGERSSTPMPSLASH